MPFGDRTGPAGRGPRTGRGGGFCGGFGAPGFTNRGGNHGLFGRGGRGWRNCFNATGLTGWQRAIGWRWGRTGDSVPPSALAGRVEELAQLKNQAGFLESALENIRKRVETLETKTKPE